MLKNHAYYLRDLFYQDLLDQTIEFICKEISDYESLNEEIDAIACSGISGIVPSAIVSNRLEKNLIIVRKSGEKNHSDNICEGLYKSDYTINYLVIDDFVDSGKTYFNIVTRLEKDNRKSFPTNKELNPIGSLTYSNKEFCLHETRVEILANEYKKYSKQLWYDTLPESIRSILINSKKDVSPKNVSTKEI